MALLAIKEKHLAKVEGKLLTVVTGDGYLSLQLLLGSRQCGLCQRTGHQLVELTAYQAPTAADIVRVATEVDAPDARLPVDDHAALDGIDQSVALAQRQVQARVHGRAAQQVVQQIESHAALVVGTVCTRTYHDMGLMGTLLPDDGSIARLEGRQLLEAYGRMAAPLPCLLIVQHLEQTVEIHITVGKEDGVIWTVMALREALDVGRGVGTQALDRAQDVMTQGMAVEEQVLKVIVDKLCRRVVITLYLVADNLYLVGYLSLGISAVEDDIGQQVNCHAQVLLRHRRIEHGALLVGIGIELTTQPFQGVDDLQRVAAPRALEGHVLAKVGQPLFAGLLMARACRYLIAAIDDWRRRWQVDDAQSGR